MSSVVTYHLRQETPMWHFQCLDTEMQSGATLRGSDVKPRFDKFLIRQMKEEQMPWKNFRISSDHDALNYKLQIYEKGEPVIKEMKFKAFFANMNKKTNKELTVFYPSGIYLKIVCFIPELMQQIEKHIQGFFLIHNFGTRQTKGFGSFSVDEKNGRRISRDTKSVLKCYSSAEGYSIYEVDCENCSDHKGVLDNAYTLYQWMKSGINFHDTYKKSLLTEYMLEKGVGGEKRWMKQNGIAPSVKKGTTKKFEPDDKDPEGAVSREQYIRAVMGVSGIQSWVTSKIDKYGNPIRDKISVSSEQIERFPSPITIKVINNKVFFLAYDLNRGARKEVLNKEFEFKGNQISDTLFTPSSFVMDDFIDYCSEKIKNTSFELSKKIYQFEMTKI